jgi:8-amino-7-oxononanoate synthase
LGVGLVTGWRDALERAAVRRAGAGLTRQVRPRSADDGVVDLAGNDYLGLSQHPEVIAAADSALKAYGLGSTGSRLVRGSTAVHADLEAGLADWLGAEASLVYSSGYLANLGVVTALVAAAAEAASRSPAAGSGGAAGEAGDAGTGARDEVRPVVISDAHNHASLVDACRLARARTVVTPHRDVAAVDAALSQTACQPALVVTESVFSVDGDLAPLGALHRVVRRHGALLLVDDAHALGVLGPAGAGGVAAAGLAGEPDVVVTATLSKALGAAGGVVVGPSPVVRHLIDTARTFIFDTGLSPAVAAGAHAAVRLARDGDDVRRELRQRAEVMVARLRDAGLRVSVPDAAVVSVHAPDAESAVGWAAACRVRGLAVGCFRPPSTPDGSSRLRLTLNASVAPEDFARALDVIVETAP